MRRQNVCAQNSRASLIRETSAASSKPPGVCGLRRPHSRAIRSSRHGNRQILVQTPQHAKHRPGRTPAVFYRARGPLARYCRLLPSGTAGSGLHCRRGQDGGGISPGRRPSQNDRGQRARQTGGGSNKRRSPTRQGCEFRPPLRAKRQGLGALRKNVLRGHHLRGRGPPDPPEILRHLRQPASVARPATPPATAGR